MKVCFPRILPTSPRLVKDPLRDPASRLSPAQWMGKPRRKHWHRDHRYGETEILVCIPKARARHTSNACHLEQRECIFSWTELTPVIDGGIIIDVNLLEQV